MGYVYGVDIASFQGVPDWAHCFSAGYRFAYVKTTQFPRYINPFAIEQRRTAFQGGFKVGNYCYAVASLGAPEQQAHFFLSRSDIQAWHLLPFLDLEEAGSEGVSPHDLEDFAYRWGKTVCANLGVKRLVLYTDLNMLKFRIRQSARLRKMYLLDLADWTLGPPPRVPGWTLAFHQFRTNRGVPGFHGTVDEDRALIPLEQLTIDANRAGKPKPPPKPPCTTFLQRLRPRIPGL